jgi:hypothetical protein
MIQSPWVPFIDGLLLAAGSILLLATHNLRQGTLLQHRQAFTHALGGTANLILLAIPLTLILLSIAAWIIIFFVVVLAIFIVIVIVAALL